MHLVFAPQIFALALSSVSSSWTQKLKCKHFEGKQDVIWEMFKWRIPYSCKRVKFAANGKSETHVYFQNRKSADKNSTMYRTTDFRVVIMNSKRQVKRILDHMMQFTAIHVCRDCDTKILLIFRTLSLMIKFFFLKLSLTISQLKYKWIIMNQYKSPWQPRDTPQGMLKSQICDFPWLVPSTITSPKYSFLQIPLLQQTKIYKLT